MMGSRVWAEPVDPFLGSDSSAIPENQRRLYSLCGLYRPADWLFLWTGCRHIMDITTQSHFTEVTDNLRSAVINLQIISGGSGKDPIGPKTHELEESRVDCGCIGLSRFHLQ
jgi:hypothetical protein